MNYIEQFMQDNNIEVGEEFYIFNERGVKIQQYTEESRKNQEKFYFNEYMGLMTDDCVGSYDRILIELMSGKCKIEKIPQKPKSVWDLTEEDMYYFINCYGEIDSTFYDYEEDLDVIKCGNAFLTEEEAKHEVERRKCEAILLKYGTRDLISLGDNYTKKYYIQYDYDLNKIMIFKHYFIGTQGAIDFKTEELAQKAIEEAGEDRLKKYVFNVKE